MAGKKMKTKLLYLSSAIAMALVSHHGYANCILDKANILIGPVILLSIVTKPPT